MATQVFGASYGGGLPLVANTYTSKSGGVFGGATKNPTTLGGAFDEYKKIFPAPTPVDLTKLPKITVPKISVPRITPAVVATPADLAGRLDTIYAPRMSELERAQELSDKALASQAAAAGLGDSGVAIGARQVLGEQFERDRTALIGQKASDQLATEFAVLMQNAANQQEARLLQANLDATASGAYAQMVMQGSMAEAENYLAAIGINADIATAYRDSFMSYFTEKEKNDILRSQQGVSYSSMILDAMLKQAGLELDASKQQQDYSIQQQQLAVSAAQPVGEFGFNPKAATTPVMTPRGYAYKPVSTPTTNTNPLFTAQGSPTLSATQRLFGQARTSIGGL